jgi:hypothetical protein
VYQPKGSTSGQMVYSPFGAGLDNFTFDNNVYFNASDPTGAGKQFNVTDTFKIWPVTILALLPVFRVSFF